MKIYKVTYKSKKGEFITKEFTRKREADNYYIDVFLSGGQFLEFEEVKTSKPTKKEVSKYFVKKQIKHWQYVKDLDCYCWVTIFDKKITPFRDSMESANMDFANLGYLINNGATVQCYDDITPEVVWVRYIVQKTNIL